MQRSWKVPRKSGVIFWFAIALLPIGCGSNGRSPAVEEPRAGGTSGFAQTLAADGRVQVSFRNEVENLKCLESNPSEIERELLRGRWLVIVYATLSAPDVKVAADSDGLARRLQGIAKVAIRPTTDFHESRTWIPRYKEIEGIDEMLGIYAPLWLLMEDGTVTRWHEGRMTVDEGVNFAKDKQHR